MAAGADGKLLRVTDKKTKMLNQLDTVSQRCASFHTTRPEAEIMRDEGVESVCVFVCVISTQLIIEK